MTAKEKAKELVQKFKESAKDQIFSEWEYVHKKSAIIAVDEIIDAFQKQKKNYDMTTYWHPIDFYKEVKDEIEKL